MDFSHGMYVPCGGSHVAFTLSRSTEDERETDLLVRRIHLDNEKYPMRYRWILDNNALDRFYVTNNGEFHFSSCNNTRHIACMPSSD
jgi:hypothetical protein